MCAGDTPLVAAAGAGHGDTVAALLRCGAGLDQDQVSIYSTVVLWQQYIVLVMYPLPRWPPRCGLLLLPGTRRWWRGCWRPPRGCWSPL